MQQLLNALKAQAGALDLGVAQPRLALVTSVDPSTATARVTLQPEGVLSGWLPVLTPWAGNGWGLVCLPSPGTQVLVIAQEGHADHGMIIGAAFSATAVPPAAPAGEFWLVHQSGSYIKLIADGTIQVNGDLHVAGDVYDSHGSLNRLRQHYDVHVHPGVSGPPNPQD
jgi:phage baseplate assembly protein gpV